MSNETDRKCRKAAVLKYYEDGVPIKNIAEEFGIEIDTVRTYIREYKATSKQEEIENTSAHKLTIRNWVEGITVLDALKTPKGKDDGGGDPPARHQMFQLQQRRIRNLRDSRVVLHEQIRSNQNDKFMRSLNQRIHGHHRGNENAIPFHR